MERITTGHGKLVMYGYELLSFLRETVDLCPRLGIHAFAESLYARIKRHNCYIPIPEDRMRKQLTKAFHEFTVVQTHMDDPSTHCRALGVPLGECPACRGSQSHLHDIVRKKIAATGAEGVHVPQEGDGRLVIHSVYVDGHFGIPHFKAAGKSSASEPPLVKRLFPDDAVAAYLNDPATKATRNSSLSCADFSADSMVARASNQYDRSGISGLFCRHGVIIALLNMFTGTLAVPVRERGFSGFANQSCNVLLVSAGERWAYATMLLEHVLRQMDCRIINFWYDINCRYKNHAIAWAEEKQELNEELTTWVSKLMSFPLGSFHGPMHNALCQSINSLRSIPEAGLGTGEPPEYAWSHMRRSGHLLQYMSLATRALHLERVALLWNKTRKTNLVQFLVAAYKRADLKYREKTEELRSIMHQAVHMKFSLAQVRAAATILVVCF